MHVPIRLAKINEREPARLEGNGNSHVLLLVGVEINIVVSEQFGNIHLGWERATLWPYGSASPVNPYHRR